MEPSTFIGMVGVMAIRVMGFLSILGFLGTAVRGRGPARRF